MKRILFGLMLLGCSGIVDTDINGLHINVCNAPQMTMCTEEEACVLYGEVLTCLVVCDPDAEEQLEDCCCRRAEDEPDKAYCMPKDYAGCRGYWN